MRGQERTLVLGQERRLKGFDDRREPHHRTVPHPMEKPFISALIACVALWAVLEVRWVYLAVVRMEW